MSADTGTWVAFIIFMLAAVVIFVIVVVEDFKQNHADRMQRRINRLDRKLGRLRIELRAYKEIKELGK